MVVEANLVDIFPWIDMYVFDEVELDKLPTEELLIVKDYIAPNKRMSPEKVLELIRKNLQDDFTDASTIAILLCSEIAIFKLRKRLF